MSTITELNSTVAATMTFAEGRALDDCTGGIDKHALAEAKKQEKQAAAALKKAAKDAEKHCKAEAKAAKDAEKQCKAEAKAAKDAEKQRKAEAKAAKDAEKQRKTDEKEAEKQRKLEEKVAKAEAIATKKVEKEAEKQRKLEEKTAKAEAAAAKKAERDAKKAERDAKKAELPSSPEMQFEKIEAATTHVETLQNPVTDEQAAEVSEVAINTPESPTQVDEQASSTVHPPPELAERTETVPSALVESVSIDAEYEKMEKPHTPPELIGNTDEASEEEPKATSLVSEGETDIKTTPQTVKEVVEDEWDKEIHDNETDAQKIVRFRKEANDLIRRARELEKSLPAGVSAVVEKENDSDMREIEGVWYHVDTDGMLYNRSDEMVGFVEKDDEVTFSSGWNSTRGSWTYE
jgi:hypothetical protein